MLGVSLADHIDSSIRKRFRVSHPKIQQTELIPMTHEESDRTVPSVWRRMALITIVFIAIAILITRLAMVQLIKGNYYKGVAEGNGIIKRPIEPPRGIITARDGTVLVRNAPYIQANKDSELIPYKQFMETASNSAEPNVLPIREYQFPQSTAHILGYISLITGEELQTNKKLITQDSLRYGSNDYIGRTGIEESYERLLKGKQGVELVEINAKGEVQKKIAQTPPVPGYTIQSTINIKLQNYIYDQLKNTVSSANAVSGIAVVQNPQNGEILALVNYPSFDNNSFTHDDHKKISEYLTDNKTPLLNRAIAGAYPPGSTYKIVTALAGLESKKIDTDSKYDDTGNISISGITFNNWYFTQYGKSEGAIDVRRALARSNDTFFYKMSLETGVQALIDQSYKFNLGNTLGIDIPGEASGMIPTPEWKEKTFHEQWYPGNTVNMSIGQGDVLTTPLQINTVTSAIANNGTLYPPILVNQIKDGWGNLLCTRDKQNQWQGDACSALNKDSASPKQIGLQKTNLKAVQDGMHMVTRQGGTAFPFFDFKIETAGKTGTAETGVNKTPHAWYTGYAPYDNPEIAVTVLIENGGEGSRVAAPLARQIMDYYFKNK